MSLFPTIGRIVLYRAPNGVDLPAIITATVDSITEHWPYPAFSSSNHVHLTVFGIGPYQVTEFEKAGEAARAQPVLGSGPATPLHDVPHAPNGVEPSANSWRFHWRFL